MRREYNIRSAPAMAGVSGGVGLFFSICFSVFFFVTWARVEIGVMVVLYRFVFRSF